MPKEILWFSYLILKISQLQSIKRSKGLRCYGLCSSPRFWGAMHPSGGFFHGIKWAYGLQDQLENLTHSAALLRKFIEKVPNDGI